MSERLGTREKQLVVQASRLHSAAETAAPQMPKLFLPRPLVALAPVLVSFPACRFEVEHQVLHVHTELAERVLNH